MGHMYYHVAWLAMKHGLALDVDILINYSPLAQLQISTPVTWACLAHEHAEHRPSQNKELEAFLFPGDQALT